MEILESAAYVALGFIPTLALLEIAYRRGMKLRRKRGIAGRAPYQQQSHYCQLLSGSKKMDKANVSIRKYFSKQTLSGISSHIAAKNLIFRHPKLRLNFSVKRMFELLAYNGAFGITPYSGAGLEMYFYCNYRDEYE
jgi:hypothetical protein